MEEKSMFHIQANMVNSMIIYTFI